MMKLYKKIAPVAAKIALALLVVSIIVLLGSRFYIARLKAAEEVDAWAVYYASWAEMISTWLAIVSLVLYIMFDIYNIWFNHIRKGIVSLKRSPSTIPLVMMAITFLYFSLNLTDVSDTTAKIQSAGMGLSQFCIMLFSLLSMVCMLNAFPRRKKPNIPMIVLMFAMFGLIIYCDVHYTNAIWNALYRPENPIKVDEATKYIPMAYNMLNTHMILTIVCAALVALMPLYSKLLKLINTSVALEDNGQMAQIEIND